MKRAVLIIAILLVAAPAFAKHSAHSCKASIYAVHAHGQVSQQSLISPQQVASVAYGGVDQFTGMGIWRIVLTPQGANVNARYTKSHLGGKLAVRCGNVSVGQFAIQAPSVGSFIISSNELGPEHLGQADRRPAARAVDHSPRALGAHGTNRNR